MFLNEYAAVAHRDDLLREAGRRRLTRAAKAAARSRRKQAEAHRADAQLAVRPLADAQLSSAQPIAPQLVDAQARLAGRELSAVCPR
jgi:hypothetical protein